MQIRQITEADIPAVAGIIRAANIPVAEAFGLNRRNAPSHPSFCTPEWIRSGLAGGERYFVCKTGDRIAGCVAYEDPGDADPGLAYLNRLAVLPACQRTGVGAGLVNHVIGLAGADNKQGLSIGIIEPHHPLKAWYEGLGFVAAGTKTFGHLPFDVQFMRYHLPPSRSIRTFQ